MLRRICATAGILALVTVPLYAQEVELVATDAEIAGVTEAIAAFDCEIGPSPVEKENDNLFELDDANCGPGQYDIKLDGAFTVIVMTYDGPVDAAGAAAVEATAAEENAVDEALDAIECEVGEGGVEKEADGLFEVDDAECEIGQFDIKLDGDFNITTMTRD